MSNPLDQLQNEGNYLEVTGSIPVLELLKNYSNSQFRTQTTKVSSSQISTALTNNTDALIIPSGTIDERPSAEESTVGQIRFNSELNTYEGFDGTQWGSLGGGGANLNKTINVDLNDLFVHGDLSGVETNASFKTIQLSGTDLQTIINDKELSTQQYVNTKITELIDGAPGALDTLNELAAAIGDDSNYAAGVTTTITNLSNRVDASLNDLSTNYIKVNQDNITALSSSLDSKISDLSTNYIKVNQDNITALSTNKQNNLTFGISAGNAVKIHSDGADGGNYARFGDNGIKGRTVIQVKGDLNLNNVTNESKSTMFTDPIFTGTPKLVDKDLATQEYVDGKITDLSGTVANIIENAPDALNTLNELAAAIGDDANYAAGVTNTISNLSIRVDASLNDLSQNYYTNIVLKAPLNNPSFTGNVGIGIDNPGSKLYVKGDGSLLTLDGDHSNIIFVSNAVSSGWTVSHTTTDTGYSIKTNSTSRNMIFGCGSRDDVCIKASNGNVGIGTSSPGKKLHIQDNADGAIVKIERSGNASIYFGGHNGWGNITSSNKLSLGAYDSAGNANTATNKQLVLSSSGRVGIGTSSPATKLDVVGDISCSSLNVGGVSITQNGGISSVNNKGQTFFDLLTQQPAQFKKNGEPVITAAFIDVNWHFDDILANQQSNILAKLAFQSIEKNKSLPFINEIKIDISGNVDSPLSGSNTWLSYYTFTITNNDDYNTANFKTYKINKTSPENANNSNLLNILSKTEGFDVRVYGLNYAKSYPSIQDRALLYENLQFLEPLVPPAPRFQSENNISFNDSLVINYDVSATEIGRPNSLANIISAITEYSENETNSSSIHPLVTTELTDTEPKSNIEKNINFPLTLSNLRAGTKYNYKVKVENSIKDEFSAFSDQRVSNMLRLPDDNSVSTTVVLTKTNNVFVTTPTNTANLSNDFVTYINTEESSSYSYTPTNTSTQTIQITDPYSTNQQNSTTGYGKLIDNSSNLVNLKCSIDGTLKQTITFNGFNTASSNNGTATRTNQNSNTFNYFDSPSQTDIYTDDSRKGFRLKGTFSLNQITNTDAVSAIGDARSTAHTITYNYTRDSDVGAEANSSSEHDVYIDTLSTDPSANTQTNTATVKSVIWTMGIPSVETIDISFVRKYININSSHMYIPGNRIIAKIKDITKVNTTAKNITLARNTASGTNNKVINNTGTYEYTSEEMKMATDSSYYGAYYDEAVGIGAENGTTLTVEETVYSLKATVDSDSPLSVDHYFDKDNYNSTGSSSINRKCSYTDIYEITDSTELAKLDSNIGGIGVARYTISNDDSGHQKKPKNWTLLFISGKFRTNASVPYPNVNNYEWDSIVTTGSQYSDGTTAYAKDGTTGGTGKKFKWIVFEFNGTSDISTFSTGEGDVYYLNVYEKLSNKGFTSTVLQKIKPNPYADPTASEMGDKDVICFVKQKDSNNTERVGNLLYEFQPDNNWYVLDADISLSTMLTSTENPAYANFGCLVERSNIDWGAKVLNNTGNNIYLFLGLNNSVNLY